ncbi:MAG: galactokinase family protein [bacterium]
MSSIGDGLARAGMSAAEVRRKVELFEQCRQALAALSTSSIPAPEDAGYFVPGRIEVLGKHTDYAGGRSLLCAMERGIVVRARPRDDALVRAVDVTRGEVREASLAVTGDPSPAQTDRAGAPLKTTGGDWATYLSTVVHRIARDFPAARRGVDIVFASDLPAASGMSSSSALVIAFFLAIEGVNALSADPRYREAIRTPEELGEYLGAVENGRPHRGMAGGLGVGTLGGSQDQTAILCCRAGHLTRVAFCPVRSEGLVPFPVDRTFVLAYSGVAAEKTASARQRYNEASLATSELLSIWNAATCRNDASLGTAVSTAPDAAARLSGLLEHAASADFTPRRLRDRLEQFVTESVDIIPHAADAFAADDMATVGTLVARSQRGAEQLLGNQVPETIDLVRLARELGADAASAFGAGFGGSVWALARADDARRFCGAWEAAYRAAHPEAAARAEFMITKPGPGALRCGHGGVTAVSSDMHDTSNGARP